MVLTAVSVTSSRAVCTRGGRRLLERARAGTPPAQPLLRADSHFRFQRIQLADAAPGPREPPLLFAGRYSAVTPLRRGVLDRVEIALELLAGNPPLGLGGEIPPACLLFLTLAFEFETSSASRPLGLGHEEHPRHDLASAAARADDRAGRIMPCGLVLR